MKSLYPFQQALVDRVRSHWRAGVQIVGLWSATGTGKTEMAMAMARETLWRGGAVLFVVDRVDLVTQNLERWQAAGFSVGAVCGSLASWDWAQSVVIAAWQTLAGQPDELRAWADRHRSVAVIVDEAHEVAWVETIRNFLLTGGWCSVPWRAVLLTATPYRMAKHEGMLDLVETVIEGPTPSWACEQGYLTPDLPISLPWEGVAISEDDAAGLTGEQEEALALQPTAIAGAVRTLVTHGSGRRTLGYAVSVRHAEALVAACAAAGLDSIAVTAKSTDDERKAAWQALAAGRAIVWNVGIAVKGLDVPTIDRIIVCRVLGSLAWWLQAVGRGMRRAEGKRDCMVLDCGGNVARFGPSHAVDVWKAVKGKPKEAARLEAAETELREAIEQAQEDGDKPVKTWRSSCGKRWLTKVRTCPHCGEVKTPDVPLVTVGWPTKDGLFSAVGLRVRNVDACIVKVGEWQAGFLDDLRRLLVFRARHPLAGTWHTLTAWTGQGGVFTRGQWVVLDGTVTGGDRATFLNRVALKEAGDGMG